jgi:hypothetical protein
MRGELVLPAFQMDCRDWLVITPEEAGLPDEVAGTPLLAVLSTVVLDQVDFRSVSAVLTVGLLDDTDEGDDGQFIDGPMSGSGRIAVRLTDAVDDRGSGGIGSLPAADARQPARAARRVHGDGDERR